MIITNWTVSLENLLSTVLWAYVNFHTKLSRSIVNFIDGMTNSVTKVVIGLRDISVINTIVSQTPKRLQPNYYLCYRICRTINKIVYYQHLLVSFWRIVVPARLSAPFALVDGCINNNWLNLWKKMRVRCSKAFRLLSALSILWTELCCKPTWLLLSFEHDDVIHTTQLSYVLALCLVSSSSFMIFDVTEYQS